MLNSPFCYTVMIVKTLARFLLKYKPTFHYHDFAIMEEDIKAFPEKMSNILDCMMKEIECLKKMLMLKYL